MLFMIIYTCPTISREYSQNYSTNLSPYLRLNPITLDGQLIVTMPIFTPATLLIQTRKRNNMVAGVSVIPFHARSEFSATLTP
ncbi:hypothetical protein DVH24_019971 [Malus domestica]|uniref:Uncharacterized protein n=1 Tax=Malus domestica TaxID=3750 RepID=A0A498I7K9_MALDO|nr:hypothetical protein DVH24_019971 [Malus domestica]